MKHLLLALCALLPAAAAPPNVLFIVLDDTGFGQLGCYGSPIATPNLDKLASEGMLFSRAYCQIAVCGASRASLMTSGSSS